MASLTRERQCVEMYENVLKKPFNASVRTSLYSSPLYGIGQGLAYWVIGSIFYYGSQLLMNLTIDIQAFYVTLMSIVFSSIQVS